MSKEKEAGWTTIDAEVIQETPKAIFLDFGVRRKKTQWIPKSCYRVVKRGNFNVQQIKTWFIGYNNLWNYVNLKNTPN